MPNLSIIMPTYNEEKRIGKTLEEYSRYFDKIKKNEKINYEILVVINNTNDKTEEIVKKHQKKNKNIKYLNFKRGGKGFAIIKGFQDAVQRKIDLIGFVDADLATKPEYFYDLVKNIKDYDGVIANRWLPGSKISVEQTLLRKITSKGFNFLVRSLLFLNFSDTQCGAKLFKREPLEKYVQEEAITQWAFDVDLLYKLKKNGYRVKEIPTTWEDRRGSKLKLMKVPFQMFTSILRIRLLNSPFKFIVKAYNKLPEKIKIHNL